MVYLALLFLVTIISNACLQGHNNYILNVVSMLEFCSQKHEFGKPNVITFKSFPENNLSLQDTKELNKTDVSTPKVK